MFDVGYVRNILWVSSILLWLVFDSALAAVSSQSSNAITKTTSSSSSVSAKTSSSRGMSSSVGAKSSSSQASTGPLGSSLYTGADFPDHVVSLIFDDGPDVYSYDLAKYLHDEHVFITFNVVANMSDAGGSGYLTGNYINNLAVPTDYLKEVIKLGHRLGNHTFNHIALAGKKGCDTKLEAGKDVSSCTPAEAEKVLYQVKENQKYISQYVSNKFFTFTPPGFAWNKGVQKVLNDDPDTARITAAVAAINQSGIDIPNRFKIVPARGCAGASPATYIVPNADDWAYAGCNINPADFSDDFLLWEKKVGHGIFLLHDFNSGLPGRPYALEEAQKIVPALKHEGYVFVAPVMKFSSPTSFLFSGDTGAGIAAYPETFRVADVNGDGYVDVCERRSDGYYCSLARYNPSTDVGVSPYFTYSPAQKWLSVDLTNSSGWGNVRYSSTIQLADVDGDGKADLVYRNMAGLMVSLSTGNSFSNPVLWSKQAVSGHADFSNAENIWQTDASYYSTFRVVDINSDGKADVCARGKNGIRCALSLGDSFAPAKDVLVNEFNDAKGFNNISYAATFQLADMNGDGSIDIVMRSAEGIKVALGGRAGFAAPVNWSRLNEFSDTESVWKSGSGYYSFRAVDVNGDGRADLCAKSSAGVVCAFSNGAKLLKYTLWESLAFPSVDDSRSIMFGDINGDGRPDILAKKSTAAIFSFSP